MNVKPWFAFHLPLYTFPDTSAAGLFERVVGLAQTAEELGFAQVSVMDHLYQIGGVGELDEPMLEGWSVLNALARETTRVRLGTMVSGVTYRNPALLAKMATTLDVTSGGRALLGIGAAWNEAEHIGYGYEFPPVRERMDRLDEALMIIRSMFSQESPSFEGTYYSIFEARNYPRPIQPAGPLVLVGGGGEKRTLRIAAKYADMTHWFASLGVEGLSRKSAILDGYCAEIGRDPTSIERTMGAPVVVVASEDDAEIYLERVPPERRPNLFIGTPRKAAEQMQPYLDAGFTGFTFNNSIYRTTESMRVLGELLHLVGG